MQLSQVYCFHRYCQQTKGATTSFIHIILDAQRIRMKISQYFYENGKNGEKSRTFPVYLLFVRPVEKRLVV